MSDERAPHDLVSDEVDTNHGSAASHDERFDPLNTSLLQRLRTRIERRAGGENVIDEEDRRRQRTRKGLGHDECITHCLPALLMRPAFCLCSGGAASCEKCADIAAENGGNRLGKNVRLIETPDEVPGPVQRYRTENCIFGYPKRLNGTQKDRNQRCRKHGGTAVFHAMDGETQERAAGVPISAQQCIQCDAPHPPQ